MSIGYKHIGQWLVGIILLFCAFFIHNRAIFVDIMESRNMITAREMVYDGNWLTPTMNGELRLEKPPLPTWIAAVVETISPDNLAAQRAMAGLAAVLLVIFTARFAYQLTRDRLYALLTALLLCTSYNVILMGRTASWDIYCHAFMMMAIYYLYRTLQGEGRLTYWLMAGLAMGLSFLGKGPVSFYALLLPFLCAYLLFYRKSMQGKWQGFGWMIAIMLLLSSWWYIYIYVYHPDMSAFVFKKESASWMNRNVRPWYYYWKFFLESGVWSLLTIFALLYPVWKERVVAKKAYLFSLVWMLAVLVFLSLMPEKKSRYLLPILIPCAMTGAHLFRYWMGEMKENDRLGRVLYRVNAGLISVAVLIIPVLLYLFVYERGAMSITALGCYSVILWGIDGVALWACLRVRPALFMASVVSLFLFLEVFLMPYIGSFVTNSERHGLKETRTQAELKPLPFYYPATDTLRIEMVYEAYKKIRPINLQDTAAVHAALPFVLVSERAEEACTLEMNRQNVIIEPLGRYDDNPWPRGHRRYTQDFIKYLSVWKRKE